MKIMMKKMTGKDLICAERARQINELNWSLEHDDGHRSGELMAAAHCYRAFAHKVAIEFTEDLHFVPAGWPWEQRWWKPSLNPVRNLIKAGALYLAEAERCERAEQPHIGMQSHTFAVICARQIEDILAREKPTLQTHMKKHLKYLSYVVRHKWFVLLACIKHGIILRGIVHDWSKFLPSEWFAYAEFFYGRGKVLRDKKHNTHYLTPDELIELEAIRRNFDRAWLKHQHHSPHHWQHHILREDNGGTKVLEMSPAEALEMVCDWIGAGRAITGKADGTLDWYMRNRDKMALGYRTRVQVETLLRVPEESRFIHNAKHTGCCRA